jgi:3-oxoacyl-ACP reductase-like protein
MLLAIVSVFSTLIGASVAAGASVAGASVAAAVASGPAGASVAGASVAATGAHAVRITSAREIKIIQGLRFDWDISSSSGKVVWDFLS